MRRHSHRRRNLPDVFAPIDAPTWLVVRDESSQLLEAHELEPGADQRLVFITAALRRMTDGWLVEDFGPVTSVFFCSKDGRRVSVGISRQNPSELPPNRQQGQAWGNVS